MDGVVEAAMEEFNEAAVNGRKDAVWLTRPMTYSEFVENYKKEDSFKTCIAYTNYVTAALRSTGRGKYIVATDNTILGPEE